MPIDDKKEAAMELGRRLAEATLARMRAAQATRAKALEANSARLEVRTQVTGPGSMLGTANHQSTGFLVALGDSWFDYPFHDVLKSLDHSYGYDIESAAHRGDRIESMAYTGGQVDQFAYCLEKVLNHGIEPKAVLLSGGGNDIVADDFGMLINSALSPIAGWNTGIVNGIIGERVFISYYCLITQINAVCMDRLNHVLPIVIHGYDYMVPDGRGVLGGWGPLPGPWLKPGFHDKSFNDLPANLLLMHDLIDTLNTTMSAIASDGGLGDVRYLDLRGTLNSDLTAKAYKSSWANELHPSADGFEALAASFAYLLGNL